MWSRWLVSTVARLAGPGPHRHAEVGIFDAEEIERFATGARRDSRVAVSTGLLRKCPASGRSGPRSRDHHVANGDMVPSAAAGGPEHFVIFLARVIGGLVDRAVFRNDREESGIDSS